MSNDAHNTPATSGRQHWWRRVLNLALLAGSVAATLIALTVVVALLWWLSVPPAQKPIVAAPRAPAPPLQATAEPAPQAAAVAPPASAPASKRPGSDHPMQAGAPVAPTPAEPPRQRAYKRTGGGDAERNRAIAQGLQQLARDPKAVQQLGIPDQGPSQ